MRIVKRVAMGTYCRRREWTLGALLAGARRLYRDDGLQWRSPAQERAIAAVTSRAKQVVIVLGTGAGKSLLFMLLCTLDRASTTILILPLVSLWGDLACRATEMGIEYCLWLPEEPDRTAPLVFATVKAAGTTRFCTFAAQLAARQELDRIVIDKAHLTVTDSDYRRSMVQLALICSVETQFVYLTATLLLSMQGTFEQQNNLLRPKVVQALTNRLLLSYIVVRAPSTEEGALLGYSARMAMQAYHQSSYFDQARNKIILYVNSRDDASELSGLLGCSAYISDAAGTPEEKEALLRIWVSSLDQPYIVATSALGVRFDHIHIRLVVHTGEPRSLINFA